MKDRFQWSSGRVQVVVVSIVGGFLIGVSGCASEPPKPATTVTPDQVRGHADKTFEKLKLEEQNRSADPAMPR